MDEILQYVNELINYISQNGSRLSSQTQQALASFLQEVMGFIEGYQRPQNVEPPITDAERLLWILSGGQEDAFVNYLRTFPDPALNTLLRNPDQLRQTIERLRQSQPIEGEERQEGGIPHAPLESSNIYGYRYDPKSGKLLVRFQSGSIYSYDGIPQGIFKVFQQGAVPAKTSGQNRFGKWWVGKIPSLGAAFYNMIRQGGFPYQRVA
jgi:hypothetical protein